MAKGQLIAGVDSSTQSVKVVIRDSKTGELVRQGRASHPDGTEVDPVYWLNGLNAAISDAGGIEDISAISIALVWILILENLIGAVKPVTLDWMPGNQFAIIAQGGTPDISYSHALSLGSFYVFVALLVSSFLFTKRDVAN